MFKIKCNVGNPDDLFSDTLEAEFSGIEHIKREDAEKEFEQAMKHPAVRSAWIEVIDDPETVLHELNKRLAGRLADRAIQQNVDSDELRARVGDLIDPEIVDEACEIVDDFFRMQDDETEDFLDFLMSNKSVWEAFPGQAVES